MISLTGLLSLSEAAMATAVAGTALENPMFSNCIGSGPTSHHSDAVAETEDGMTRRGGCAGCDGGSI